ncbi:hypothetical protein Tco_1256831 [Tanacetum coccineum]
MDIKLVKESSKKAKAEIAQESSSKRAGEALEQESSKKQKVDDDNETEELKQCMEIILDDGDDVTIKATPLSTKSPTIVDYKICKEGKKSYFQIIRAYGNSQMYLTFGKMLKKFNREDFFLDWSRNSLRKAMYLNEVFRSILLVIMKLLIKKLDDFEDKYQV